MKKTLTIPTPILLARHTCDSTTPGDRVLWKIGDQALFHSKLDGKHKVTIDSDLTAHEKAPGDQCYEVKFSDGSRSCVSAKQLSIGEAARLKL